VDHRGEKEKTCHFSPVATSARLPHTVFYFLSPFSSPFFSSFDSPCDWMPSCKAKASAVLEYSMLHLLASVRPGRSTPHSPARGWPAGWGRSRPRPQASPAGSSRSPGRRTGAGRALPRTRGRARGPARRQGRARGRSPGTPAATSGGPSAAPVGRRRGMGAVIRHGHGQDV
jgi:hypothetical protein